MSDWPTRAIPEDHDLGSLLPVCTLRSVSCQSRQLSSGERLAGGTALKVLDLAEPRSDRHFVVVLWNENNVGWRLLRAAARLRALQTRGVDWPARAGRFADPGHGAIRLCTRVVLGGDNDNYLVPGLAGVRAQRPRSPELLRHGSEPLHMGERG